MTTRGDLQAEVFRARPGPRPRQRCLPELRHADGREARHAPPPRQRRRDRRALRRPPELPQLRRDPPRYQDSRRLAEDAIAIYRKKQGLLSADEISAVRDRFDLTQADLARLLRLGANTVSRWESGRNVQSAAMDMLLRLIRDVPGSIPYLRDRAA